MGKVLLSLFGALCICGIVLSGSLNGLPLIALHYLFALAVTAALGCVLLLGLVFGLRLMRWVLFLDDASATSDVIGSR